LLDLASIFFFVVSLVCLYLFLFTAAAKAYPCDYI
jgi:hypothetical protein